MRRLSLFLLLAVLLPGTALAASSRPYTNTRYGFSLRYPGNWHLATVRQLGVEQVMLSSRGAGAYAMMVSILPVRPGATTGQTLTRFLRYERRQGDTALAAVHWSPALLAGKPALAGVTTPPTEGGVVISQGLYVTAWRSRIFDIVVYAHETRPLASISRIPVVYRRILASWRFR